MSNSRKSVAAKRVQYAALPYRMNDRTQPEVMLVTSRETRRWIIPTQGQGAPPVGGARSVRRSRSDRGRQPSVRWVFFIPEAAQEGRRRRLRSARLCAGSEAPEQRMA